MGNILLLVQDMAMVSKYKIGYTARLLALLLVLTWVLVACFVAFQYHRERQFKAEMLDERLQMVNSSILNQLSHGKTITLPKGLRLTVLDTAGRVLFDPRATSPLPNHLSRPEVAQAALKGRGFAIDRTSSVDGQEYFYSATKKPPYIIRTAIPYNHSLRQMLKADQGFLWFMAGVTLLVTLLAWGLTRRLGNTVKRLDDFAQKAGRGERIYDDRPFPNDELGSISRNIVSLYARLQQALLDGERQHKIAINAQEQSTTLKKQLINNINHELKTPVAAMQACLETMADHPDLDVEQRKQLFDRTIQQCRRLAQLLADVSTLTRIEDGSKQISMQLLDLGLVTQDAIDEVDCGKMIVNNHLPSDLMIKGNPGLLASVIRNLVSNAIAHSNGTRVDIELAERSPHHILVKVTDNGHGVDSQHLAHLFERFYRVEAGRTRTAGGGTGLGLAIVKNAIILHGGKVSAVNVDPHGLCIMFTLPLG